MNPNPFSCTNFLILPTGIAATPGAHFHEPSMVWCVQNQSHRRCCTATAFRRAGGDLQAKRVAGGTRLGHAYLPLESEESRKRCAPAQTVFGRSKADRKRPPPADQAASRQIRDAVIAH